MAPTACRRPRPQIDAALKGQRAAGFAAGVPTGLLGNGLMTGAVVGLAAGVTPDGWLGFVTGADVVGRTGTTVPAGRVPAGAGVTPPGFVDGATKAGVPVTPRAGVPLLDVPGFAAGACTR